ncbi:MAG: Hpt domain-containing protein [Phormidium tanganyikae FI6-MK23]|nr:Hpt domain-containing protein [Phormidium tanganyikae FI6-MK23]
MLEQATQAENLSPQEQHNAVKEAHKLTGALGSFGYEVGSKLARSNIYSFKKSRSTKLNDRRF